MRWLVVMCLVLTSGCMLEHEISGRWNVGGPGGCQLGHEVTVEIRDGGQDYVNETYSCSDGAFSGGIPSSVERFWVQLDEIEDDGGPLEWYAGATVEAAHVTDDFNIGLVLLQPAQP